MTEGRIRVAIAILALAGAGIASYLLFERYTGGRIVCTGSGCETVQHSSYAEIAGVPVALVGLAGYVGLVAAALARGETACAAAVVLALPALAFSVYLLVIQLAVIHAVCVWCVTSDVVVTLITLLALARIRVAAHEPARLAV